jgi:hypothetical protein
MPQSLSSNCEQPLTFLLVCHSSLSPNESHNKPLAFYLKGRLIERRWALGQQTGTGARPDARRPVEAPNRHAALAHNGDRAGCADADRGIIWTDHAGGQSLKDGTDECDRRAVIDGLSGRTSINTSDDDRRINVTHNDPRIGSADSDCGSDGQRLTHRVDGARRIKWAGNRAAVRQNGDQRIER